MKLVVNTTNTSIAHVDIITSEKGILNTYTTEADFWASQAPIASQDLTPSADYDTLTYRALVELGPDWTLVEKD